MNQHLRPHQKEYNSNQDHKFIRFLHHQTILQRKWKSCKTIVFFLFFFQRPKFEHKDEGLENTEWRTDWRGWAPTTSLLTPRRPKRRASRSTFWTSWEISDFDGSSIDLKKYGNFGLFFPDRFVAGVSSVFSEVRQRNRRFYTRGCRKRQAPVFLNSPFALEVSTPQWGPVVGVTGFVTELNPPNITTSK